MKVRDHYLSGVRTCSLRVWTSSAIGSRSQAHVQVIFSHSFCQFAQGAICVPSQCALDLLLKEECPHKGGLGVIVSPSSVNGDVWYAIKWMTFDFVHFKCSISFNHNFLFDRKLQLNLDPPQWRKEESSKLCRM